MIIERDQSYKNYCCDGFDWIVAMVFQYGDEPDGDDSIWGVCHNPNCPEFDPAFMAEHGHDHYRGVTSPTHADFEQWMTENNYNAKM